MAAFQAEIGIAMSHSGKAENDPRQKKVLPGIISDAFDWFDRA
jgi:hypothetical protein